LNRPGGTSMDLAGGAFQNEVGEPGLQEQRANPVSHSDKDGGGRVSNQKVRTENNLSALEAP
jgi:hypothetical protein